MGIDPALPTIGQFSPLDQRFAPMAALGTYWIARREIPDLQIVLVDRSVVPSERSRRDLEDVSEAASGDPNIHIVGAHMGLSQEDVNALQRSVAVVLQLGVPFGFGWGVAECQWKHKPAVVGRQGQLPEQSGYGTAGIIADGASDAAAAVIRLFREPETAAALGHSGHERVARDHLITGLLADYLRMFGQVTAENLILETA
jgi:trehalose synthase